MRVDLFPGDKVLRRAQNGWICSTCDQLDEGTEILDTVVAEERDGHGNDEDPEGVLAAIDLLFGDGYHQMKRRPGYTTEWHTEGREAEEDATEALVAELCLSDKHPEMTKLDKTL